MINKVENIIEKKYAFYFRHTRNVTGIVLKMHINNDLFNQMIF